MAEAVTQKDFELFKREIINANELFKKEIISENKLFQQNITNKFELFLLNMDKKIENMIGNKVKLIGSIAVAVVVAFIVCYTWYFETTHNSINRINHENARLELERTIRQSLADNLKELGVGITSREATQDRNPSEKQGRDNKKSKKVSKKS